MRITTIIIFCIINIPISSAQNISCQIIDSKTKLPIPYANIGIVNKNIGTVSDSLGNFNLSLKNMTDMDTLRISMISYQTKNFNVGVLRKSKSFKVIPLDEKVIRLKEVVITNIEPESFQIGLKEKHCYPIPLYRGAVSKVAFPQKNYRHEIGTRFTNSKMIKLDSIQLNFAECNVEKLDLRLNIYSIDKDNTIENILKHPIYISLTKSEGLNSPIVHLTNQDVVIDSDFLVAIENYKNLKDGAVYLFANFRRKGKPYPTYYRHSSQSSWLQLKSKKSKNIGISILTFAH